jgi:hypothetical protein
VWQAAEPDLPVEIEPFSFLSVGLLDHLSRTLTLSPGQLLADLACGRGAPGLWLARAADASLIGVDSASLRVDRRRPMEDQAAFDIVPRTEPALITTMVQMLAHLAVIGVVARVLLSAISSGLHRKAAAGPPDAERGLPRPADPG